MGLSGDGQENVRPVLILSPATQHNAEKTQRQLIRTKTYLQWHHFGESLRRRCWTEKQTEQDAYDIEPEFKILRALTNSNAEKVVVRSVSSTGPEIRSCRPTIPPAQNGIFSSSMNISFGRWAKGNFPKWIANSQTSITSLARAPTQKKAGHYLSCVDGEWVKQKQTTKSPANESAWSQEQPIARTEIEPIQRWPPSCTSRPVQVDNDRRPGSAATNQN